jgi:hypothetical protein
MSGLQHETPLRSQLILSLIRLTSINSEHPNESYCFVLWSQHEFPLCTYKSSADMCDRISAHIHTNTILERGKKHSKNQHVPTSSGAGTKTATRTSRVRSAKTQQIKARLVERTISCTNSIFRSCSSRSDGSHIAVGSDTIYCSTFSPSNISY